MNHQKPTHDESDDDYVSKTGLKREAAALQKLGEELVNLKPAELERVPLDEDLIDAIAMGHKLKGKHEALRRHLQYVGKMMRNRDTTEIKNVLDQIHSRNNSTNARLHKLEQWRDRLLSNGDDAINAVIGECHTLERQKLRQLISRAKKEAAANQPPAAFRELFKYLREHMDEQL